MEEKLKTAGKELGSAVKLEKTMLCQILNAKNCMPIKLEVFPPKT